MTSNRKGYFYIIFLVFFISFTSYAQGTIEKSIFFNSEINLCEHKNQNNSIATVSSVVNLDISNKFRVKLFAPEDSFAINVIAADSDNPSIIEYGSLNNKIVYSVLMRTIIENYKYDFSESFIDILFFDDIDLARKRTI